MLHICLSLHFTFADQNLCIFIGETYLKRFIIVCVNSCVITSNSESVTHESKTRIVRLSPHSQGKRVSVIVSTSRKTRPNVTFV